jgi:uncharacterized protein (DUF2062 family)
MAAILNSFRRSTAVWLRQGISPRRLALTLALGFAIGCIPVVGLPTLICAALALVLRLNLPAIQAANYAVMPLQLILIAPFVRMGERLFASSRDRGMAAAALHTAVFGHAPLTVVLHYAGVAVHALVAWLVVAGPAVAVMTVALTLVLRRIPALSPAEAGD